MSEQRLIDANALKDFINEVCFSKEWAKYRADWGSKGQIDCILKYIDNAPPVELTELCKGCQYLKDCETCDKNERPQGEYVDISKLRFMTVE